MDNYIIFLKIVKGLGKWSKILKKFQIYQFVGINRDAMVSRAIHWHLESIGKSLLTIASAVSFNFSRMAGARGK